MIEVSPPQIFEPSCHAASAPPGEAPLQPGLAPFVLLRIATLPIAALDALRLPATEARAERILASEGCMQVLQTDVEDALFAAVPRVAAGDKLCRRQLLKLRRDVHNRRCVPVSAELRATVHGVLARPGEHRAFDTWADAANARSDAMSNLEPGLRSELQTCTRPALRRPREHARFRQGLAFASAGVERSAVRERRLPTGAAPDNLERSLLGYLARAAAKTSPFSSFMGLAVVDVDPHVAGGVPGGHDVHYVCAVNFNRGAVARLHARALPVAARAGDFDLRLNPTLRAGAGHRVHALCNREVVLLGRPWWEQRFAQFRLGASLWQTLCRIGAAPWPRWVAAIREAEGADAAAADTTVACLLERGVLLAPELSDAFTADPLARLAAHWTRSRNDRLRLQVPALERLHAHVGAIATSEGEARIASLDAVRAQQRQVEADLPGPACEPLQNLVLEDCWVDGIRGALGPGLLGPLEDLQTFLSGQVVESTYYARMRREFVSRFGRGGTCTDAVDFLLRAATHLVDVPEFGARWSTEAPAPAAPGVCVPVTAQVQIAATHGGQASCVVVNRVFDGAGWLAARFTEGGQPGQTALRARLTRWLRRVSGAREPVDIPVSGHCSDLQAHRLLTRRVLRWPGEPLTLPPQQVVDAARLRIHHDPCTDLLEVTDGKGAPLNLVYLGTTFPSPIWGLRYALSILTQPYLIARPDFPPPDDARHEPVRAEPRITRGRVVLRRATWWVSSQYLLEHWFSGTPGERLLRAYRERDRWRLPPVFFAQCHQSAQRSALIPADALSTKHKPLWIDARNPLWLAMLERLARASEWLMLVEALPGPGELWLQLDHAAHVCELQVEMLIEAANPDSQPLAAGGIP